ncbi:DsbA family protein [Gilliamella sp. wkB112]|uniref:DsbA family protein n=1 Tax=Gilliamella sp. wkB112 TaxID=3120257 RepID=UPI0009BDACD0|nr:DsbA family protein [Gilliamella apicola]
MKKTLIAISALVFSVSCLAAETPAAKTAATASASTPATPQVDKQYTVLPTLPSPEKEVIEFFSFNCPSCYMFETQYHGSQVISQALPKGVNVKRYHLLDFGPLSKELSEAWAVANVLDLQDKASLALYQAVQRDRTIQSIDDIKAVFATLGIDAATYDKTKDSFLAKAFMAHQVDAIKELKPNSIPAVYVNNKFYIDSQGLDTTSNEAFVQDYARVAAYLVNLNPNVKAKIKSEY